MSRYIAFHLIPSEEQKNVLQGLSEKLAERFDGPAFEPHLTLYWGKQREEVDAVEQLQLLLPELRPIQLRVGQVVASEVWTKALHLSIEANSELLSLSERLSACFSNPETYVFSPHITLLYASLTPEQRAELLAEIGEISIEQVELNCVRIISAQPEYNKREHMEAETRIFSAMLEASSPPAQ